jgi:hypothetical protein
MAGTGGEGPSDRAWRAPVVLGLVLIACSLAFALLLPVALGWPHHDRSGRFVLAVAASRDFWVAPTAAAYVANGALGFVYEASPFLTALPLYPILLAPLVAVGDALGLSAPPAPTATMYFLLAPFTAGLAIPLLQQVRGLVRDASSSPASATLPVQAWTAVLVAVPVLVVFGHGEDALALLALLAAVRLAGRQRWAAAGLLLGFAIASKQWALLALPALLVRSPRSERARLAAASLALPAVLALFVLAVDWPHASRALLHPPNYPAFGHAALWVDANAATVLTAPFRLGALALAAALATRSRGGTSRLLAVLGLTLLARAAFEPVAHVYYLAPGLCLLLLHERLVTGRCTRTAVGGSLLVAWFELHPDPALWWAVAALLGAVVAYRAGGELLSRPVAAIAGTGEAAAGLPTGGPASAAGSAGARAQPRATAARDSRASGSHQ